MMTESELGFITDKSVRLGLQDIRRRRRWAWFVFWAFFPAMAAIVVLGESVVLWGAAAWMALWAGASVYAWIIRCPRCGGRFHFGGGLNNPWTRSCLHCGLRLRADQQSDPLV